MCVCTVSAWRRRALLLLQLPHKTLFGKPPLVVLAAACSYSPSSSSTSPPPLLPPPRCCLRNQTSRALYCELCLSVSGCLPVRLFARSVRSLCLLFAIFIWLCFVVAVIELVLRDHRTNERTNEQSCSPLSSNRTNNNNTQTSHIIFIPYAN